MRPVRLDRHVELNLDHSAGTSGFDESRRRPATALAPAWVDEHC